MACLVQKMVKSRVICLADSIKEAGITNSDSTGLRRSRNGSTRLFVKAEPACPHVGTGPGI